MSRNRRNCESFIRSKNKINETKIKRVFAVLVFAFDSFVFLSALSHSFIRRCSGAIARARFSMKQKKRMKKKRNELTKSFFQPCAGARRSLRSHTNRIEIQFRRIGNAYSRHTASYQSKRIRSTNCRARANTKCDFFLNWKINYTMNEIAAARMKREKNARQKTKNRMRNQIDKQTCKAVSGDTIVSTRILFCVMASSSSLLVCLFPSALSLSLCLSPSLRMSVCAWILNGFKHFQFAVEFAPHVNWNVEIFISRCFFFAFNLMQWRWLTLPGISA